MSDKKLLKEATIRRFMKLANVDTLTNSFIQETAAKDEPVTEKEKIEEETEEETLEEENFNNLSEEEEEEDMEIDMGPPDDAPAMDMPAAEEAPEMGTADMSLTEEEARLLVSLGERLSEALASAEDAPEEEEPEGEESDVDPSADVAMDDEMAPEEDLPPANRMYEVNDQLVQEVLKRVTKRIVAERAKK